MDDNSSSLCHIDTIGHIAEKKKSLYPTESRMVSIDELSQILSYLHESIRKCDTCTRLDHTILDDTQNSPLFFEESKSNRRESWIDAEDNHTGIIGINHIFIVLCENKFDL